MKKFACILGIILSLALISLGIYILADESMPNGDFSGLTVSSTSFGADFYTYSYKATRAAANNVDSLGDFVEDVSVLALGGGFTIAGVFGLLLSMYGLAAAKTSKRQIELLEEIRIACRGDERQIELLRQIANKQFTANVTLPAASEPARNAVKPAVTEPVRETPPARPAVSAPARESAPARQSVGGDRWICNNCKHSNPARLTSCDICGEHRDAVKPAVTEKPAVAEKPAVTEKPATAWRCPICAMENAAGDEVCSCCGEERPVEQN